MVVKIEVMQIKEWCFTETFSFLRYDKGDLKGFQTNFGPAFTDKKVLIKDLGWRMVNILSFIHQPIWLARKVSDVSAADWQYQTHVKNYRDFTHV